MLSKNLLARSDGGMFLVDKIFDLDFHNFSEIGHFWTQKSVKMVILKKIGQKIIFFA